MKWKQLSIKMKTAYAKYDRFMEKQGFGIVLAVCVMIILSSALVTYRLNTGRHYQSREIEYNVETGLQEAQTLKEAQEVVMSKNTASMYPEKTKLAFSAPVEGFLTRDFSVKEPIYFAAANYYRLHPAIDFLVEYGTPVRSVAEGRVNSVAREKELGLTGRIRHSDKYESVYAGLSDASYVKAGDPVIQGQTIGHSGNDVFAEKNDEPHLHFEVWLGKTPVDPVELFLGITH